MFQYLVVPSGNSCVTELTILNIVPFLSYLVCIPTYEFVICPFFRKYIPRLKIKIGLGMLVLLAAFTYLLAVDASAHVVTNRSYKTLYKDHNASSYQLCFLYSQNSSYGNTSHLTLSSFTLVPFLMMTTVGELLIFLTILEFICAQAPQSMRSFLISSTFFVYGVSAIAMSLFILPFGMGFKSTLEHLTYSCGTVFFSFVIGFGTAGFIVYLYVCKWYKNRQRGGQHNINYQTVIESYYEKVIDERQRQKRLPLNTDSQFCEDNM